MKAHGGLGMLLGITLGAQVAPSLTWNQPSFLPRLAWEDSRHVFTAPSRWEGRDWALAGLGVAAVVGAYSMDGRVDDAVLRHQSIAANKAARKVEGLGGMPGLVLVGGTYAYGHFAEQPRIRNAAADAGLAVLITRVLFVLPAKELMGRSRPDEGLGPRHLEVLKGDSFPSGHSAQAFALASVVSVHADRAWVTGLSFGLAGLVGLARIEQRQHHLSDVVAGGLLGTAIGFGVAHHNVELRGSRRLQATFRPVMNLDRPGVQLALKY